MENDLEFNLHENINNWLLNLKQQSSFTDSDIEELKCHFLDIIDDLKVKGLDEEEACYIASKRLGNSLEWGEDFKCTNNSMIQLRKCVMILSGIIAYFFTYYLVLFLSKILLYLFLFLGMDESVSVNWVGRFLISVDFLIIIGTVGVFFMEERVIRFLDKLEFETKRVIYFLLITFFLWLLDINVFPVIKNIFKDLIARSILIKGYMYFEYSFPALLCICFILLYLKFNRKNNL